MTVCPFAAWKPVANHGGRMSGQLGLVLHVQEGNNSLAGWFNNPVSDASSTFWVSKSGALEQYVDCDVCAWAQGSGNTTYQSVETEGYHTEALSAAQLDMLGRLYAWGAGRYGWPNLLAEAPGDDGLGWHGMGGSAWGGHTGCPGDVRKPQRADILARAFAGGGDDDMPLNDADKAWITQTVSTVVNQQLRTLFAPDAECFNRVVQADQKAIAQSK